MRRCNTYIYYDNIIILAIVGDCPNWKSFLPMATLARQRWQELHLQTKVALVQTDHSSFYTTTLNLIITYDKITL